MSAIHTTNDHTDDVDKADNWQDADFLALDPDYNNDDTTPSRTPNNNSKRRKLEQQQEKKRSATKKHDKNEDNGRKNTSSTNNAADDENDMSCGSPSSSSEEEAAAAAAASSSDGILGNHNDQNEKKDNEDKEQEKSSFSSTTPFNPIHDIPPWMMMRMDVNQQESSHQNQFHRTNSSSIHPLISLHNEIVQFTQLMEPLPKEIQDRQLIIERITQLVYQTFDKTIYPDIAVHVFGSYATGLLLPSSDIDVVVYTMKPPLVVSDSSSNNDDDDDHHHHQQKKKSKKNNKNNDNNTTDNKNNNDATTTNTDTDTTTMMESPLHLFANALQDQWLSELSYMEIIEHTRIPLVKFTHGSTDISVDVCFNQFTGVPAAQLMTTYLQALPPLRPLTFVLKYFLQTRGLNEPYSGGMGSFMLQLLIVSFLQHRERDAVNYQRPSLYNLGCLLIEFFEFYGIELNYLTTGISVRYDGMFFSKGLPDKKELFIVPDRPFLLALENPLDTSMDVGRSTFRVQMIQRAFAVAYRTLLAYTAIPYQPTRSILATILPVTNEMLSRRSMKTFDRPLTAKRNNLGEESVVLVKKQ